MNVRTVQKKDVIYQNGTSPLYLRFTHQRKNKFVSLGISVLPEHWDNEAQKVCPECPENRAYNEQIRSKHEEYQNQIKRLEILEIEVNLDTLFGEKSKRINCTVALQVCNVRLEAVVHTLGNEPHPTLRTSPDSRIRPRKHNQYTR